MDTSAAFPPVGGNLCHRHEETNLVTVDELMRIARFSGVDRRQPDLYAFVHVFGGNRNCAVWQEIYEALEVSGDGRVKRAAPSQDRAGDRREGERDRLLLRYRRPRVFLR
jgi:hypothetical protein